MAALDITSWQVDALRVTVFSSEALDLEGKGWWRGLTGTAPETSGTRMLQGERFESGFYLNGVLEIKTAFNRLDCVLSAFPQVGSFPRLNGNPDELSLPIVAKICDWIATLGFPIVRVAFGMTAVKKIDSREAGNRVIMDYVQGVTVDPEVVQEFGIQLSYPFSSDVISGCQIHPLSKWACIAAQLFTMQVGVVSTPSVRVERFCRVEFDVYTPADRNDLIPNDALSALGKELAEAAMRQLRGGVQK